MKKVSKINFFNKPTRIEFMESLSKHLGGPKIFIKRDDLTEAALGGNKVRKLEYLMADCIEKKCRVVFTLGGPQSNHARITAGISAMLSLKCVLVLSGKKQGKIEGNLLLDNIFGAKTVYAGTDNFDKVLKIAEAMAGIYEKKGWKPYLVPLGGANGIGSLGYVECFLEILAQAKQLKERFDYIIIANGSGGTQAGLETGKIISNSNIDILGISVLFKKPELAGKVYDNIFKTLDVIGAKHGPMSGITLLDEYIGAGYAIPSRLTVEAIKLVGRREGIVLDPVYTGKAFGGLIDLIGKKAFSKKDKILFIHTGGYPGIVKLADKDKKTLLN